MLNYKLRRFLIGASISLSVAIALLLAYNLIFLRESPLPSNERTQEEAAYELVAESISSDEALGIYELSTGSIKFYRAQNGQIIQIDETGQNREVVDNFEITGLSQARWDESGILSLTQRNGIFTSFNHQTKTPYTFPQEVTNAVFYEGNSIIYTFNDGSNVDLSIINADGSDRGRLISLRSDEIRLHAVPEKGRITYTLRPSAYRASTLNAVSLSNPEVEPILSDKFGLDVVWSPDGNYGVITYTTERGGGRMELALIDSEGTIQETYNLSTVAEKIIWAQNSQAFYVLEPEISRDRVMPDDYYENKISRFTESLYLVRIDGTDPQLLSENIGSTDASELTLNRDETVLFFVNQVDNLVYRLPLQ